MNPSRKFSLSIALFCFFCIWGIGQINPYMEFKTHRVEVFQLYSGTSTGKYSKLEFIAVYKNPEGTVFDQRVSPSEFSQLHVGDKVDISVRQFDIEQTTLDNVVWFFGALLFQATLFTGGVSFLLYGLSAKFRKWIRS
ncbi:putative nrdC.7 [Pseudomonas phage OBP]|uniref:putative nrdC.7 n=1 Tax=Pseudomonas phage OBP TaxID=1124849 RepID=UPI000240D618|nr:putative nrdC.7 [Pseudomonas phage OBP]AEV89464.1 putative nrdC.7 [Pseudomonas phage OBP]